MNPTRHPPGWAETERGIGLVGVVRESETGGHEGVGIRQVQGYIRDAEKERPLVEEEGDGDDEVAQDGNNVFSMVPSDAGDKR